MTDYMTIRPATGTWVVRAAGAVIAETKNALELSEGDYPPVIYIPRGDIAMAFLDQTEHTTHCPKKGDATYYSIVTKSTTHENAAWSYEKPIAGMERIEKYLAFYATDVVTIERV